MAGLILTFGENAENYLHIPEDSVVIGRSRDCDIIFKSDTVSRKHAKIFWSSRSFFIEDLTSRNGTMVNGLMIDEPTKLKDNDEIVICEFTYRFKLHPTVDNMKRPEVLNV